MHVLFFVLFLLAVVCFVAAAFRDLRTNGGVGVNLVALGLAFGFAVFMVQQARLL